MLALATEGGGGSRLALYGGLLACAWLCPVNALMYRLVLCAAFLLELALVMRCVWHRPRVRVALLAAFAAFCAVVFSPSRHFDVSALRERYVTRLTAYDGVRYRWGGEGRLGIDCSGLPRKALRDALWREGLCTLNGGLIREALRQWWFDASAKALAQGYRGYLVPLQERGTIRTLAYDGLQPGDLAVTESGIHVVCYLGDGRWVQAEPEAGRVLVLNGRTEASQWFGVPVRLYRWRMLEARADTARARFDADLETKPVEAAVFGTATYAGKRATICRVNVPRVRLRLFRHDAFAPPMTNFCQLAQAVDATGETLVFAMNAGMFRPDRTAQGLLVDNGQMFSRLDLGDGKDNFYLKPNGVFLLSDDGSAKIVESTEYSKSNERVILATQSGPLLIRKGKIHPAFRSGSVSRLKRNGVGVVAPDTVVFAITDDPMNFHEFASLFRDVLNCSDALYLDGVVSSLYAPEIKRFDSGKGLGPIITASKSAQ